MRRVSHWRHKITFQFSEFEMSDMTSVPQTTMVFPPLFVSCIDPFCGKFENKIKGVTGMEEIIFIEIRKLDWRNFAEYRQINWRQTDGLYTP